MEKINVISGDQTLDGEKIGYIELDKAKYIIYSLNEKDEEKYEKLYVNKFVDNEEDLISDGNWDDLKKKIPNIVKQIKSNNITDFVDLDFVGIDKVSLNYSRAFKLKENIVDSIKKRVSNLENDLNEILNETSNDENKSEEVSNNTIEEVVEKTETEEPVSEEKNETVSDSNDASTSDSVSNKISDDLDDFLNNISSGNIKEEIEKSDALTETEIEIQQLKEELEKEKKTNDMLQNKIISLEIELKKDKELLEQIKIMVEKS